MVNQDEMDTCRKHGMDKKSYSVLVLNPDSKRPLLIPRCRREYNNEVNLSK
jgi:hypothetical protein